MRPTRSLCRSLAGVAFALGACTTTSSTDEATAALARHAAAQRSLPTGGQCTDLIASTCTTELLAEKGITMDQCAAIVQPSVDECVQDQQCAASSGLDQCNPDDKATYQDCVDAASAAYLACMGPPPSFTPPPK
jgi:hypothetical protein